MFPPRCCLIELGKLLKGRQIESVSLCATLMNETTIADESGKIQEYTQEWVYLGIRKTEKHSTEDTIDTHANMETHYNGTHESIERRMNIPPKQIDTDKIENMEANPEQITKDCMQHNTRQRARMKREARQEGF